MLPIDNVPVDDRAEVGLGEFARIAERGGKVGRRTGVGGYPAGLLDVQRHGIHHVHLVPELGQWGPAYVPGPPPTSSTRAGGAGSSRSSSSSDLTNSSDGLPSREGGTARSRCHSGSRSRDQSPLQAALRDLSGQMNSAPAGSGGLIFAGEHARG
jgi:hypothetical protein